MSVICRMKKELYFHILNSYIRKTADDVLRKCFIELGDIKLAEAAFPLVYKLMYRNNRSFCFTNRREVMDEFILQACDEIRCTFSENSEAI